MINVVDCFAIFFIHFFADFVLQNEWMGANKSKEWAPLLTHIGVYTVTCLIYGMFLLTMPNAIMWALVNGLAHLVVDYISSRAMRRARESGNTRRFFLYLGIDQMIHAWFLLGSFMLLS